MLNCRPHNLISFLMLLLVSMQASAVKLAIVIDDFGYRVKEDNLILALPVQVSIAILPDSPHGKQVAEKAHQQGREILIHMPMKPLSKQPLEKNTLAPSMSQQEVDRIIRRAVSLVPYASGMNNHMGSEMTSSLPGMINVMQSLSHQKLYFLDSMTIGNTQASKAAGQFGVPVVRRNIFIDNSQSEEETRSQLNKAVAYARKHGSAIAIGHPHPSTVRALQKALPQLPADVELVAVSTIFKNSPPTKVIRMQPETQSPLVKPLVEPKAVPKPEIKPVTIGICEFPESTYSLEGIDFLMFMVEAIYHDPALQPLLSNKKPPLFSQKKN